MWTGWVTTWGKHQDKLGTAWTMWAQYRTEGQGEGGVRTHMTMWKMTYDDMGESLTQYGTGRDSMDCYGDSLSIDSIDIVGMEGGWSRP